MKGVVPTPDIAKIFNPTPDIESKKCPTPDIQKVPRHSTPNFIKLCVFQVNIRHCKIFDLDTRHWPPLSRALQLVHLLKFWLHIQDSKPDDLDPFAWFSMAIHFGPVHHYTAKWPVLETAGVPATGGLPMLMSKGAIIYYREGGRRKISPTWKVCFFECRRTSIEWLELQQSPELMTMGLVTLHWISSCFHVMMYETDIIISNSANLK